MNKMKIGLILQQEKEHIKNTEKYAKRAVSIALIASALVFVAQFAVSFLYPIIYMFLPENPDGYISYLVDIGMYVFYIGLPFLIALPLFSIIKNKTTIYKVKRSSPKKPVLFVLGALGCGYIVNLIALFIFPSLNDFGEPTQLAAETPLEIALCFTMYAILPALLEEWAFRGVLLKHLLPYGKWGAIIISSILFGLGHLHPRSIINAVTFGIVFGIAYEYTGSLKLSMLIHFINNAISTTISLLPQESIISLVFSLLIYVIMGFSVGAIIYYANNGYKRQKFTLRMPNVIGYKLSIERYISKFVFNIAIIPYAALFAFYFFLAFCVQL